MKSAGVQRQYSGTPPLAKSNENIDQLMGELSDLCNRLQGHTFLDRRLYLPEQWCADRERCTEAKVPTKTSVLPPSLNWRWRCCAMRGGMGVPMRWVTGDEVLR